MMPRLSVIVPVRERVELLHHMLETLVTTADHPELVEVIVRCDDDDDACLDYLRRRAVTGWLNMTAPASFIVGSRLNGYATLPVFINEAARLARADLVIVVNDDVEFQTQGWDTRLVATAARYPDGFFNLGVNTILNNPNVVFPCQSRKQIATLGCFYDERLIYTDIWLRDVLQPFGRVVPVPEVTIAHQWRGMSPDQGQALAVTQTPAYQALYAQCVEEGRAKIRAALPC
jgi:Glycosyl transferase family 2